jgi:hypothetical protein
MAREAQAVVDLVCAVEMRIVDEAFPADGGTGLLKVDAHDDAQVGGEFADGALKQAGVFAGGFGVVNGAWADENEQAIVLPLEDGNDLVARVEYGGRRSFGNRKLFLKENRRENDLGPLDTEIFSGMEHGLSSGAIRAALGAFSIHFLASLALCKVAIS